MSRRIIGPFNRVEGDLTLNLELEQGRIQRAEVNSPMFRGFERILVGRHALDALAIVPRICGICSVSQSIAAAHALAQLYGVRPPANGQHVMNLTHAAENVADHLSHFYLFFMPDFARDSYATHAWHAAAAQRFTAQRGQAHAPMLQARATLMRWMGTLAGHWPHTLSLQAGGVTRTISAAERIRLQQWLGLFRQFLEQHTFGCDLEIVAALDSDAALQAWAQRYPASDFAHFLRIAEALSLADYGQAWQRFVAAPAYPQPEGGSWSPAGVWAGGEIHALDENQIREDLSASWYSAASAQHPFMGETQIAADKAEAYSWCKAPRLNGLPAETGALARALMQGQPLLTDLVKRDGGSVRSRVVARVTEMARLVLAMADWLAALSVSAPYFTPLPAEPVQSSGRGLCEAARGMLGHWVVLDGAIIERYQIIAPTTWNFSPRDALGQAGPLEKALEQVAAEDKHALMVQHIVRSFDPCQVCTVH